MQIPKMPDVKTGLTKIFTKFPQMKKKQPLLPFGFLILVILVGLFLIKNKSILVVAKVDNTFIVRSELDKILINKYGSQTLDELITIALIKNELSKQKISVSDIEVSAKLKEIEGSLGGTSLTDALKSQGATYEEFKEQLNVRMRAEKLLATKVVISEDEIKSFISQFGAQLQAKDAEGQRQEALKGLQNEKLQQAITDWINKLKASAKIEKYL